MWNTAKYSDFLKNNKGSKISEFAYQAYFDITTLKIMSLEYEQSELINKLLSRFGNSQGLPEQFSSDARLNVGELELWITTGYDYLRKKNLIIHLNTIFENYLYNFSKFWIERRPGILDKSTVSLKEIREKNKSDIFNEKKDSYIQDLLFGDYYKIFDRMKTRIGADLQISPSKLRNLDEFYEIRNILVHANGRISSKLATLFPEKGYKAENQLLLSSQYIGDVELLLVEMLFHLDTYLSKIFPNIATKDLSDLEIVSITYYYT